MSEHHRDDAFVRALLAQDGGLDEEHYAEYRRQLDRKLESARRPSLLRRRAGWIAAGVAAASVLVLLVWRPWRSHPTPGPDDSGSAGPLVVLRLPAKNVREWAPYELELSADVIVTATLGEPFRHDGEKVVPLRMDRVLKGGSPAAPLGTKEPAPMFCCSSNVPGTPGRPEPFPRDNRALVYLSGSTEAGWSLLAFRPLDGGFEARELPGIERCLAVAAGCESAADRRTVEDLVCRQGQRPITAANIDAARALGQLPASLGPVGRELAKEAWLALLRSYRPPALPPDVERRLVREVVRLLREQSLSTAQTKEIREVVNGSECEWFRQELKSLVR